MEMSLTHKMRHQLPTLDAIALQPAIYSEQEAGGVVRIVGRCPDGITTITLEPGPDRKPVDLAAVGGKMAGRIRKDHSVKFDCDHLRGVGLDGGRL